MSASFEDRLPETTIRRSELRYQLLCWHLLFILPPTQLDSNRHVLQVICKTRVHQRHPNPPSILVQDEPGRPGFHYPQRRKSPEHVGGVARGVIPNSLGKNLIIHQRPPEARQSPAVFRSDEVDWFLPPNPKQEQWIHIIRGQRFPSTENLPESDASNHGGRKIPVSAVISQVIVSLVVYKAFDEVLPMDLLKVEEYASRSVTVDLQPARELKEGLIVIWQVSLEDLS
ncbi:hypothetical protein AAE478_006773 [Parahypoxylon ruwenzoriense]